MVQTRFSKFFPRQEIVHKQGIIEPQRMIRYALITSGAHDQVVRTQLNYAFVSESQSWIVTQYRLELVDCYQGQDDLRVETLVCEANRFFCNRRFRFYEGDRLLAIVEAQYVILDLDKRRIVRLPIEAFQEANLVIAEEEPAHFDPVKWEGDQAQDSKTVPLAITPEVIDENGHVNNLVYIGWALVQLASQAPYSSCYIKYGSELLPNDQVEIRSQVLPLGDQQWVTDHQIYNVSNDKVACLVQFVWNQPVDLA